MDNRRIIMDMADKDGNPIKCEVLTTFRLEERDKEYIVLFLVDENGEPVLNEDGVVQIELFRFAITEAAGEKEEISITDIPGDMEFEEAMEKFGELMEESINNETS